MITFQVEKFAAAIEEAQPLLEKHWDELALHKDCIPFSPNYSRYAALDASGRFLIVTGRNDGALVAYAAFRADLADHYSTTLWAEDDLIWVMPEYRRADIGSGLITRAEKELRDRGAVIVQIKSKIAHPALAMLLDGMGYERTEIVHTKMLQRPE